MATNTEFCDNLRLYFQHWEKAKGDEVVGYCRKNLFKPVKLRKKDIYQCISNKLRQESQVGNLPSNESSIEKFIIL